MASDCKWLVASPCSLSVDLICAYLATGWPLPFILSRRPRLPSLPVAFLVACPPTSSVYFFWTVLLFFGRTIAYTKELSLAHFFVLALMAVA